MRLIRKSLIKRVLFFDTETTGLYETSGDRIVEIAVLETINMRLTGQKFHSYLNPGGKKSHPLALKKHGLQDKFLLDQPRFRYIVDDLLEFIGNFPFATNHIIQMYSSFLFFKGSDLLVAHNAQFDMRFLNAELAAIGRPRIPLAQSFCTKELAIRSLAINRYTNRHSLDNLCERFHIDRLSRDEAHGAVLDCQLLFELYKKLRPEEVVEEEDEEEEAEEEEKGETEEEEEVDENNNEVEREDGENKNEKTNRMGPCSFG